MKTQAIGYVRVSTLEQAEEGHSLDAQRTAIEQFCRARGWDLTGIKTDAGISGTLADRPALQEVLDLASKGVFDVVIVHAIDRFYRDLQGLLAALNHLREHNVSFTSITENLDFSTPWGKLALAVLGTLAEIYIDRLRRETRKGRRARAAKGLHNGTPSLGYCYGTCSSCDDPNGQDYCPLYGQANRQDYVPSAPLLPHPIEQHAVRLAFQLHATGLYSDGDVAEELNHRTHTLPNGTEVEFRTKGRWGRNNPGRFSKDSIRDLLQNPYYVGKVPYYGRDENGRRRKRGNYVALYAGQHEAIVEEEVFEQSQRIRDLMSTHPRTRGNPLERVYPLSGILHCGYCGEVMRAHPTNGTRYYRDKSRILHLRECPQPYLRADDVEAQLGRLVESIELAPDWRERVLDGLHPDLSVDEIHDREEKIEARLERAKRLYIDGDIGRMQYEDVKAECSAALADLRSPACNDIMALGESLESGFDPWDSLSLLTKKERSRTLFTTVLVRGSRLVAAKPTKALYTLIQHSAGLFRCPLVDYRNYGADGT